MLGTCTLSLTFLLSFIVTRDLSQGPSDATESPVKDKFSSIKSFAFKSLRKLYGSGEQDEMPEIGGEIKSAIKKMIKSMLQKDVASRVTATDLITSIDGILHNEAYLSFLEQCPGIEQLNLPPVDVVEQLPETEMIEYAPSESVSNSLLGDFTQTDPVTDQQPNRSSFGMSLFEEDEAPKTFYRESPISLDELRRQRMSFGASRRESLLMSPSPSESGRGLKVNLTSMFDTVDNEMECTPMNRKMQRRNARKSFELSPFFEGIYTPNCQILSGGLSPRKRSLSHSPSRRILFGLFDHDHDRYAAVKPVHSLDDKTEEDLDDKKKEDSIDEEDDSDSNDSQEEEGAFDPDTWKPIMLES